MLRAALVMSLVTGCAPPHRTFAPLPPTLTPDQRVAAFASLQPVQNTVVVTVSCGRNGCARSEQSSIRLGDSTEVFHPEDLAPLVAADSPTAEHIRRSQHARSRWSTYGWLGLAGFAVGTVLFIDGASRAEFEEGPFDRTEAKLGVATMGAGVVVLVVGYLARNTYYRETRAAFASYGPDLAARLSLCVQGLAMVPCEAVPPAGAPPRPEAPRAPWQPPAAGAPSSAPGNATPSAPLPRE